MAIPEAVQLEHPLGIHLLLQGTPVVLAIPHQLTPKMLSHFSLVCAVHAVEAGEKVSFEQLHHLESFTGNEAVVDVHGDDGVFPILAARLVSPDGIFKSTDLNPFCLNQASRVTWTRSALAELGIPYRGSNTL